MEAKGIGGGQQNLVANSSLVPRSANKTLKEGKSSDDAVVIELEDSSAAPGAAEQDGNKGVVKLLEAGHFKGVADIRLRINFADELAAISGDKAAAIIQDGSDSLKVALTAEFDSLLQSSTLNDEQKAAAVVLRDQFITTVQQLSNGTQPAKFKELVSQNFSELINGLVSLADDSSGSQVVEGGLAEGASQPLSDDVASEPIDPSQTFTAGLSALFDTWLEDFESSISSETVLGEPARSGKAYQKFLEIYQGIREGADSAPTSTENEQLNITGNTSVEPLSLTA